MTSDAVALLLGATDRAIGLVFPGLRGNTSFARPTEMCRHAPTFGIITSGAAYNHEGLADRGVIRHAFFPRTAGSITTSSSSVITSVQTSTVRLVRWREVGPLYPHHILQSSHFGYLRPPLVNMTKPFPGVLALWIMGPERSNAVTAQIEIVYWPTFISHAIPEIMGSRKRVIRTPVPHMLCERLLPRGYVTLVEAAVLVVLDLKRAKQPVPFFIGI
jgi:hypothetical protein